MRQLCNVSYAAQVETKSDEGELQRFLTELEQPPRDWSGRRSGRSYVTSELDALMAPGRGA